MNSSLRLTMLALCGLCGALLAALLALLPFPAPSSAALPASAVDIASHEAMASLPDVMAPAVTIPSIVVPSVALDTKSASEQAPINAADAAPSDDAAAPIASAEPGEPPSPSPDDVASPAEDITVAAAEPSPLGSEASRDLAAGRPADDLQLELPPDDLGVEQAPSPSKPQAVAAPRPAARDRATHPQPTPSAPGDLAGSLTRVVAKVDPHRRSDPRQPAPPTRLAQAPSGASRSGSPDMSGLLEAAASGKVSLDDLQKNKQLLQQATEFMTGGAEGEGQAGEVMETLKEATTALKQLAENQQRQSSPELPTPEDEPLPAGPPSGPALKSKSPPGETLSIVDEGDGKLYVHIQQEELRKVLELLSEQGGMNILASQSVQGTVSASLNGVDIEEALEAILRSTGYVSRRDGSFIYVGTPQDFQQQDRAVDRIGTRVYRPNYTNALELKTLITPLLTEEIGVCTVTTPAQSGIAVNSQTTGGDALAVGDAVVVQDYESNLFQIDQVVAEVDRRPLQVAIEAMILSVDLNDTNQFGINWEMLRQRQNIRLGLGSPRQTPLEGSGNVDGNTGGITGQFAYNGGLSFAFLDGNLGSFVNALETIGDTNVIATPRLTCLNKQRAEILIGAQLGYISTTVTETSTAQSVQFLEVGAQLRLRPYISTDGLIRMEVHPELSTGQVRVAGGFTLPDKQVTQVTTNVLVRDGCTVIIGGLMREDIGTSTSQIPLMGNLPVVGGLFRQKTETRQKREILVIVTPHIIYDTEAHADGENAATEFHRRQGVVADKMNPIGKRMLGRKYLRKAQQAWAEGDADAARKLADWAVQFDPQNRAAIDLRADIEAGRHDGHHSGGADPPQWPVPHPEVIEVEGDSVLYDELEGEGLGEATHPHDPGVTGRNFSLVKPGR